MRAFEVSVNGKRLCVAGIGDDGVLVSSVDHIVGNGRNDVFLRVGGLISPIAEHVLWIRRRLKTGDELRLKIVGTASIDSPKERHRRDPNQDLAAQKRYVRASARKLGWKIETKPVKHPRS